MGKNNATGRERGKGLYMYGSPGNDNMELF